MNTDNKSKTARSEQRRTVYIGMSGGVDSSLSAALLKNEGYNVVGVHMILAPQPTSGNLETVENICTSLNIPLKTYSFQEEFEKTVIQKFIEEYKKGNTPNPCIYCNKQFKFGMFFDKALADGADFVATGHYVRIQKKDGKFILLRGKDKKKDQSYFLYNLNQEILSRTLFPIGNLRKTQVRKIAKEFKLSTTHREESQDVCFIPNNDTQAFLKTNINKSHGNIIDIDSGEIVGEHEGIAFYTIGQRRGIGIGGSDAPYFVVDKNMKKNELYVGKGESHPRLFEKIVDLENMHWISGEAPSLPLNCEVSIRYRQKPQKATLAIVDAGTDYQTAQIKFKSPVRAVSPGQSAVIYQGEVCLGGGEIKLKA